MKQSGMAMVEALVAAGLLGLGLLGATRLTVYAFDAALQTRQLEQAQALARDAIGCALSRTTACPASASVTQQGVVFAVDMQQTPWGSHLHEVTVRVQWQGGMGSNRAPRNIEWRTRVSDLPDWVGLSLP